MKKNEHILNIFKFMHRMLVGLMFVLCVPAVTAASGNGCDNPDNMYINPELALCTTHAYNAGWLENPENSGDKQMMNDIVALKSTVMMQQMYKQYSFLEATLNRMKTQLRREILTTNFEAAGASSSDSSSSSSSSIGGNNGIAGAENCRSAGSTADVMSCLSRNLDRISTAINNSDIGAARRQIQTDLETMRLYDNLTPKDQTTSDKKYSSVSAQFASAYNECADAGANRQKLSSCVDYMRVFITRNIEAQNNNQNRNMYNSYMR